MIIDAPHPTLTANPAARGTRADRRDQPAVAHDEHMAAGERHRSNSATTRASRELIREQNARLATQISKAKQIDSLITDNGLKHPDGRYFTPKEAKE